MVSDIELSEKIICLLRMKLVIMIIVIISSQFWSRKSIEDGKNFFG